MFFSFTENLCRRSTATLETELGDTGTLWSFVPSVTPAGGDCRVRILACDECKLNISVQTEALTKCTAINQTTLPKYATCLEG